MALVLIAPAITRIGYVAEQSFTVTQTVETLEPVSALTARAGLGIGVESSDDDEFLLAADLGCSHVRFSYPWDKVESAAGSRHTFADAENGLAACVANNLSAIVLLAYGPGWTSKGTTFALSGDHASGSTVLTLSGSPAIPSGMGADCVYVRRANGTQITASGNNAYPGTLCTTVDVGANQLTLSAPTNVTLTSGTLLQINERAYAPPSDDETTDTNGSLAAWEAYWDYVTGRITTSGITTAYPENWNEPSWGPDTWDGGVEAFANNAVGHSPNWGFQRILLQKTPPAGQQWQSGYPHKSGANDLLGGRVDDSNPSFVLTQAMVEDNMPYEAFHPYPENPEDGMWDLAAMRAGGNDTAVTFTGCHVNSNFKQAVRRGIQKEAADGWRPRYVISETGIDTSDTTVQRRYLLRSYLGYLGCGIDRICFYKLHDQDSARYGWVDAATYAPRPIYDAMQALMGDLDLYPDDPGSVSGTTVPTVLGYNSPTWPLMQNSIVGRQSGHGSNSIVWVGWQRTYDAYPHQNGVGGADSFWRDVASPSAETVTISVPAGLTAVSAVNLATRETLSLTTGSGWAQVSVTDEPVAIRMEP